MPHHTKLDEKIEGADNFQAWKYRISLEENELEFYISEEVPVLEGDEAKALHKKNLVKAKRIIANSIKDHLIPHVSPLKTPKGIVRCCDEEIKEEEEEIVITTLNGLLRSWDSFIQGICARKKLITFIIIS